MFWSVTSWKCLSLQTEKTFKKVIMCHKSVTLCVSDLILPTENVVLLLWCFGKLPPNVGSPLAVRAPHQEEAL